MSNLKNEHDRFLTKTPINIITPPEEIRKVIDEAAKMVAKYGEDFEETLRKNNEQVPKFSFIKKNDPYRPYYDAVVNAEIKGLISGHLVKRDASCRKTKAGGRPGKDKGETN